MTTAPCVNLIPLEIRETGRRRRRIRAWAGACTVSLACLLVPLVMERVQRARAEALGQQETQLQSALVEAREALRTTTAESTRLQGQLDRARALRSKRTWSAMFGVVGRAMPPGTWLTSLGTDPAKPRGQGTGGTIAPSPAAAAAPAGDTTITIESPTRLRITGFAADHGELFAFVAGLRDSGVFSEVTQNYARMEPVLQGQAVAFEVVCEW